MRCGKAKNCHKIRVTCLLPGLPGARKTHAAAYQNLQDATLSAPGLPSRLPLHRHHPVAQSERRKECSYESSMTRLSAMAASSWLVPANPALSDPRAAPWSPGHRPPPTARPPATTDDCVIAPPGNQKQTKPAPGTPASWSMRAWVGEQLPIPMVVLARAQAAVAEMASAEGPRRPREAKGNLPRTQTRVG